MTSEEKGSKGWIDKKIGLKKQPRTEVALFRQALKWFRRLAVVLFVHLHHHLFVGWTLHVRWDMVEKVSSDFIFFFFFRSSFGSRCLSCDLSERI